MLVWREFVRPSIWFQHTKTTRVFRGSLGTPWISQAADAVEKCVSALVLLEFELVDSGWQNRGGDGPLCQHR